jgi:hypothetical protein
MSDRQIEPRRPFRSPRRIAPRRLAPQTPSQTPLAGRTAPKTSEVTSDTGTPVSGALRASSDDLGPDPLRPVQTDEAYRLALGGRVVVDGRPYVLHARRQRYAHCTAPPYFGLLDDGQTIAWVSHLRAEIAAPPQPSTTTSHRARGWTPRRRD